MSCCLNLKDRSSLHTSRRGISDVHLTLRPLEVRRGYPGAGIDLLFEREFLPQGRASFLRYCPGFDRTGHQNSFRNRSVGVVDDWREPTTILRIVCDGFGNAVQKPLIANSPVQPSHHQFCILSFTTSMPVAEVPGFPYQLQEILWNKIGGYRPSKWISNYRGGM